MRQPAQRAPQEEPPRPQGRTASRFGTAKAGQKDPLGPWLSIKEAAALYGLGADYFRRNYCDPGGIMERAGALRSRKTPGGRRRVFVSEPMLLEIIRQETHTKIEGADLEK